MQIFTSFTSEVVELLRQGAVGIIPTDTVYGLVGSLMNQSAVERIYEVKGHAPDRPVGTVLIADAQQIDSLVGSADLLSAEIYWPGPTSVILQLKEPLHYAHKGIGSLPFRVPDVPGLVSLLMRTGPLATTSANFANQPTATTLEQALGTFREAVDFYVDGGDLSYRRASKIIRLKAGGEVETLRERQL